MQQQERGLGLVVQARKNRGMLVVVTLIGARWAICGSPLESRLICRYRRWDREIIRPAAAIVTARQHGGPRWGVATHTTPHSTSTLAQMHQIRTENRTPYVRDLFSRILMGGPDKGTNRKGFFPACARSCICISHKWQGSPVNSILADYSLFPYFAPTKFQITLPACPIHFQHALQFFLQP